MSSSLHSGLDDLPPADAPHIDRVCDAFEAAWRAGHPRPRIEDFAGPTADPLLCELVCVDVEYRRAVGDAPATADYLDRFPDLDPEWLADVLAAPVGPPPPGPSGGGKRLGRFELLAKLGQGACGSVWRAYDPALNRVVALKVPHPGAVGSAEAVERFRREARTAAALRHPGIVTVHDVAAIDGTPVLVQDFLDGESLRDRLAAGRVPPAEAAGIAAGVADALHYAHRAGAVHRDVKPANIMICRDGRAVLVDFGLALQEGGTLTLTADGQVVGTPAYMAPEQASGDSHAVGPAADVYALGAVFYEMLAGRPPFADTRAATLLRRVIEDDPPSPRAVAPDVPRDLETVCLRAMAKEPHRRYPTAAALAADLRRFLSGESVHARPAGPAERAVVWARRHPTRAALATVSVVAAVALAGVAVVGWYNAKLDRAYQALDDQHRETESAYYFGRLALASREWAGGNVGRVRQLLDDCPPGLRGWEWSYLDGLTRRDLMTLKHFTENEPSRQLADVAYSPDGTRLATASWDGKARVWDAAGAMVAEFVTCEWGLQSVAWHPDGRRLATGDILGRVAVWDAATGALLHEFRLPDGRTVYRVAFSPDGRHLAAGGGDGPWEISDRARKPGAVRVWDHESGREVRTLGGFAQAVTGLAYHPSGDRLATAEGAIGTMGAVGRPGLLTVWDAATWGKVREFRGHDGPLTAVAYSPDGSRLATASWDRTVMLWDGDTGRPTNTLSGHRDWVRGLAFSPDGQHVAAAGADATVTVHAVATGRQVRRFRGHTQGVTGVSYSPDGSRLASCSSDKTAKVWNPAAFPEARMLVGAGPVSAVAYAPDGTTLYAGGYAPGGGDDPRPVVTAWNTADGTVRGFAGGHTDRVLCVAVSADGRWVASAGRDRTARIWRWGDGADSEAVLPDHGSSVRGVALSPDGRTLYAATQRPGPAGVNGDELWVWDVATRTRTGVWSAGAGGSLNAVAVSPDGALVAAATTGGFTAVYDAATGREVGRLTGHTRLVSCVAFSRDGRRVATSSHDNAARVWDVAAVLAGRPDPAAVLRGHTRGVVAVAFGPDGTRLATGSEDGTVKVWDARTGQEALTLAGHTDAVTGVAFSPDGRTLASGGNDGTVRLWEAGP